MNETKALAREIESIRDLAIVMLILNTGLLLHEVAELSITDIDWDKKVLHVTGTRKRDIALPDAAFTALARWSKERVDSSVVQFFTTTKGKLAGLSERSIDHLIRKYAKQAKIAKPVNAQILRNTYAASLCKEETDTAKLMAKLGLADPDAIKKYKDLAESLSASATDTQSLSGKLTQAVFPTKPKASKPVSAIDGFWSPNPEEVIFGRDSLIRQIKSSLDHGQSVLLVGSIGIGKTHILKHMKSVFPGAVYVGSPIPTKPMLAAIYEACEHSLLTGSIQQMTEKVMQTIPSKRPVLMIDSLEKLKVSDQALMITLLEHFTILGATESTPTRLNPVWWKFKKIEVAALSDDAAKSLVRYLTQNMPISDYAMMETKLLGLSNGVPLALVDMAKQLSYRPVVTRESVRDLDHEAGIRYRYWSYAFVVFWAGIVMFRFIALGIHSFEGYILAGIGSSFVILVRAMKGKKR